MMVRVVLGVTGSVAGIKVAELVKSLSNGGAEVRVASSEHGAVFLKQPQQGQAPPAYYTDEDDYKQVVEKARPPTTHTTQDPLHVDLAEWGEVLLLAPLSANTLAKVAMGLCDNLVSRIVRCWKEEKPFFVAPAMNTKMWNHSSTARHLSELQESGITVLSPVSKTLACGDVGIGAMAPVQTIVRAVLQQKKHRN